MVCPAVHPSLKQRAEFISVDLHNREECNEKLSDLGITHLFYAAYQAMDSLAGEVQPNTQMFVNAVEAVEVSGNNLQHVCLFQGAKAYGAHISAYKTPARETDPRHFPPNFYFNQEDYLKGRQAGGIDWSWSALRPGAVAGFSIGSPMNLVTALAVYGSVCKELGQPFRYPGSPAAFASLYQATDVDLLAKCAEWAATSKQCRNEIFNVTNGDYYRWVHVWPEFCEFFGTEQAQPQKMDLARMMADKEELWTQMQEKYGLQKIPLEKLVNWPFTDVTLHRESDSIRQHDQAAQIRVLRIRGQPRDVSAAVPGIARQQDHPLIGKAPPHSDNLCPSCQ